MLLPIEFYISFIAGVFAGLPIGIIFFQIKPGDSVYNIVVSLVGLIIFIFLYIIGKVLIVKMYSKKETFSFYTNFLTGMMSAATVSFLIKAKDDLLIASIVAGFIIMFFLIMAYFHTQTKNPSKPNKLTNCKNNSSPIFNLRK